MHTRVTLFAGHYGSGKTNLAVNHALRLAADGHRTALADLDIVNPYFRAKDSRDVLSRAGVRFISSQFANSNVDTPALPAEAYSVIADKSTCAVIDVGGDDRGALALGRYAADIAAENDYAMYLVVNLYRPLTRTVADVHAVMLEVEQASGLKFTAIINNSNLGAQTTADDVLASVEKARRLSQAVSLPVAATTVADTLTPELRGKIEGITPITLHFKAEWAI